MSIKFFFLFLFNFDVVVRVFEQFDRRLDVNRLDLLEEQFEGVRHDSRVNISIFVALGADVLIGVLHERRRMSIRLSLREKATLLANVDLKRVGKVHELFPEEVVLAVGENGVPFHLPDSEAAAVGCLSSLRDAPRELHALGLGDRVAANRDFVVSSDDECVRIVVHLETEDEAVFEDRFDVVLGDA